jgi:hypothetical protein
MRARFVAGLGLMGLIAALWVAPAASADTATIGAAAAPGSIFGGAANFTALQQTTDATSPSFAVPPVPAGGGPWSVTSWAALGGSGDGSASLEIWRPTGTSGEFRLIAIGPQQSFPTGVVTTHPVSIPVLPGDDLGILSGPDTDFSPTYSSGKVGDAAIWANSGTPAVGQTMGGPSSDFSPHGGAADARVNVRATLTSAPVVAAPAPTPTTTTKKKCKKKKKHKRSAQSAKKKKCKKHKKK